jgi:hypothetical protein
MSTSVQVLTVGEQAASMKLENSRVLVWDRDSHSRLIWICEGEAPDCWPYRIFGCSPSVDWLAVVDPCIKVGLPEGGDIHPKHLHHVFIVGHASAR